MPATELAEALGKNEDSQALSVHLAEYNWLTSVVSMYLRWQHQILYLAVALIGGAVALLKALPDPSDFGYALLILPIPTALLALILAGLQSRVTRVSVYVHTILRSKVANLVGADVMGWADYLKQPPRDSRFALGFLPVFAYYLPIWGLLMLGQLVPVLVFWTLTSAPDSYQIALVVVDATLVVITLAAFLAVALPRVKGKY